MEKQKDNPKFSFLFGGEFYSYYKCKLALEQQQRESLRPSAASGSRQTLAAAAFLGVACCFLCKAGRLCPLFLLSFPGPCAKIDCLLSVS